MTVAISVTAAIPIITPSVVRPERILLAQMAWPAMRMPSTTSNTKRRTGWRGVLSKDRFGRTTVALGRRLRRSRRYQLLPGPAAGVDRPTLE